MISPKVSTKNVATPVAMATPLSPNAVVAITVESEERAIFTTLLPISIVHSILSKSVSSFIAVFADLLPSSAMLRSRSMFTEENAVSADEKKAEHKSSTTEKITVDKSILSKK